MRHVSALANDQALTAAEWGDEWAVSVATDSEDNYFFVTEKKGIT